MKTASSGTQGLYYWSIDPVGGSDTTLGSAIDWTLTAGMMALSPMVSGTSVQTTVDNQQISPAVPSTLDFLEFTELAYDLADTSPLPTVPLPTGFSVLSTVSYASGLNATAFIDSATDQIVLSYRGSVTKYDWLVTDSLIAIGSQSQPFVDALKFAQNIETSNNQDTLYVTGHSLGGAEAEYVAANLSAALGVDIGGDTFAAPAVSAMLAQGVSTVDPELTDYVNAYDPVGTFGSDTAGVLSLNSPAFTDIHVGNVITMPAPIYYAAVFKTGLLGLGIGAYKFHTMSAYGSALLSQEYIGTDPIGQVLETPIALSELYPNIQNIVDGSDGNGGSTELGTLSFNTSNGSVTLTITETASAVGLVTFNEVGVCDGEAFAETQSVTSQGVVTTDQIVVNGLTIVSPSLARAAR